MPEVNDRPIPVSIVHAFTRKHIGQTRLPALPVPGDIVYWQGLGYEVDHYEWAILPGETVTITMIVQPEMDEFGWRPFSPQEEEE